MASQTFILICLSLFSLVLSDHNSYMHDYQQYIATMSRNDTYMEMLEEERNMTREQDPHPDNMEFPCAILKPSETIPTSVNKLRPGDIKVVGAMGDSFTAGMGIAAKNIFQMTNDYRGLAWSIGGDESFESLISLPNILKKYNPNLTGYSVGKGDKGINARFNLAVSGSESNNLPEQTQNLIDRIQNDPLVDFENDWKIITIMTGGNDICHICDQPDKFSTDLFIEYVTTSLDMLKEKMPRVLVNLVETINVQIAKDLNKGIVCTILHIACPCAAFPGGEKEEKKIDVLMDEFHSRVEELVASGKYDGKEDFAVVVQPFLKETFAPRKPDGEVDMSYFAPDCFHMTKKGQAAAATGLWNNMVQKVGKKAIKWTLGESINCPTESSPYFFTNANAKNLLEYPPEEELPEEELIITEYVEERQVEVIRIEEPVEEVAPTASAFSKLSNNTIALSAGFAVLIVLGILLSGFWIHHCMKKKSPKKSSKYQHMVEDIIYEKKPSHELNVNKHYFP